MAEPSQILVLYYYQNSAFLDIYDYFWYITMLSEAQVHRLVCPLADDKTL